MTEHTLKLCPCGSANSYDQCCEPFIRGEQFPDTPEQLMRSRYSAYSQANIDYIEKTMRGAAAQNFDHHLTKQWAESITWIGLEVISSESEGDQGVVEFIASYKENNLTKQIHERSSFLREEGVWYYVDGKHSVKHQREQKVGRNDPCPCGSGKKYKKCCL